MKEEYIYKLTDSARKYASQIKDIKYIITEAGCWECISHAKDKNGYIRLTRNFDGTGEKSRILHRLAYGKEKGEIPPGCMILHSCDNPSCFNPEHLSIGTAQDNSSDMKLRERQARGERNSGAKITEEVVRKIRADDRPNKLLCKAYGLSKAQISSIKTYRTWKHVE